MNNQLATVNTDWNIMKQQAEVLVASKFLPSSIKTPNDALAIMMIGQELGLKPYQALNNINVIQGKPAISPQLMLAMVRQSGQLKNIEMSGDDKTYTVTVERAGQTPHTATFTLEDAKSLGLSTRDNWKKQPKVMLQWRCLAQNLRVTFPDVILGLYTPEEMGADVVVSHDGEMTIVEAPAQALPAPQAEPAVPWYESVDIGAITDYLKQQELDPAEYADVAFLSTFESKETYFAHLKELIDNRAWYDVPSSYTKFREAIYDKGQGTLEDLLEAGALNIEAIHNAKDIPDALSYVTRAIDDWKTEQLRKTQENLDELAKGKKMPA